MSLCPPRQALRAPRAPHAPAPGAVPGPRSLLKETSHPALLTLSPFGLLLFFFFWFNCLFSVARFAYFSSTSLLRTCVVQAVTGLFLLFFLLLFLMDLQQESQ